MKSHKKIWGIRSGLIGDTIMSLPILEYLNEKYPKYYKIFVLEQKCKQAKLLYHNHPYINELFITENNDGILNKNEETIRDSCDIIFNIAPAHPREQDWYNYRNCLEETAIMAGIDPVLIKNKKPKLFKWFNTDKITNTICIFPFAGYNKWHARNPSSEWWKKTIENLIKEGYNILHCGFSTEPLLSQSLNYCKITHLDFFEQIKAAHSCKLTIGTDSGSMWVIGAYGLPQINLITNHMNNNHYKNFLALAPENCNDLALNLFGLNHCDQINYDDLINSIRKFIK